MSSIGMVVLIVTILTAENLVRYSDHELNSQLFDYQTHFYHLNTRQAPYSDPHYTFNFEISKIILIWDVSITLGLYIHANP